MTGRILKGRPPHGRHLLFSVCSISRRTKAPVNIPSLGIAKLVNSEWAGLAAPDASIRAIEEIHHFVLAADRGQGVSEQRIIHLAHDRVPMHSILPIIKIMERSGQISCKAADHRTGMR